MADQIGIFFFVFILILFILILAGLVGLFADLVLRSQEENILGRLVTVIREAWPR